MIRPVEIAVRGASSRLYQGCNALPPTDLSPLTRKCSPKSHNLLPIRLWEHVNLSLGEFHDCSHQSIRVLCHTRRGCCRCRCRRSIGRVIRWRRRIRHPSNGGCVVCDRSTGKSCWRKVGSWKLGRRRVRVNDGLDGFGGDESHQEKRLEDSISQLRGLLK